MLVYQEVEADMNKKEILRFSIGGVLILLLAVVSWKIFIAPEKVEALSQEEAQKIVQDRFSGNITNTALENGVYIVSFKLATGEYDVEISKASGEIIDVIQTKEEERIYNLSESVIRQIIKQEAPGKIESFTKETTDKIDHYEAIVIKDGKRTLLEVDGETGEVLKKEVLKESSTAQKEDSEKEEEKDTNSSTTDEKKGNNHVSLKDEQKKQDESKKEQSKEEKKQAEKEAKKAKKEAEKKKKEEEKRQKEQEKEQKKQESSQKITEKQAIEIALKKVKGEVEEIDDVDFEIENGQPYYYIEIETTDDIEYEFQIHAITGEIRSIEIDD